MNSQWIGCLQHFFSSSPKWLLLLLNPLSILNAKYKSFFWHNVQTWLGIIREFHIIIVQHWHCITNFCDSELSSQGFKVWRSLNGDVLPAYTPSRLPLALTSLLFIHLPLSWLLSLSPVSLVTLPATVPCLDRARGENTAGTRGETVLSNFCKRQKSQDTFSLGTKLSACIIFVSPFRSSLFLWKADTDNIFPIFKKRWSKGNQICFSKI